MRDAIQHEGDANQAGLAAAVLIGAATTVAASQPVLSQGLDRVNKGGINPNSWVYGPRNNDTSGGLIWNPAKLGWVDRPDFTCFQN